MVFGRRSKPLTTLDLHRYISYHSTSYVPVPWSYSAPILSISLTTNSERQVSSSIHSPHTCVCTTSNHGRILVHPHPTRNFHPLTKSPPGELAITSSVRWGRKPGGPLSRAMETNRQPLHNLIIIPIHHASRFQERLAESPRPPRSRANLASKFLRAGGSHDQRNQ